MKADLRGTWRQALGSLAAAVLLILGLRWALFEPYVIPSGSMMPTLLVNDHIVVNKFAFGIRLPFTTFYLLRFGQPTRGDVLVFRSIDDHETFLVKRVVGLPGEEIRVDEAGQVFVDGALLSRRALSVDEARQALSAWSAREFEELLQRFVVDEEELGVDRRAIVLTDRLVNRSDGETFVVPADSVFMMGDNRDHSADSRVWGSVPLDRVLGRASLIWLACEETLPDSNQLCDPESFRWKRLFSTLR